MTPDSIILRDSGWRVDEEKSNFMRGFTKYYRLIAFKYKPTMEQLCSIDVWLSRNKPGQGSIYTEEGRNNSFIFSCMQDSSD